jgi:hypothetical protein
MSNNDDKPRKSVYPPHVKLAMSIAMAKAAKRNDDPMLAERAEELEAQAYEELRAAKSDTRRYLN